MGIPTAKGAGRKGRGQGGCLIFHHIYTTMSPSLSWWLSSKLCALLLLQHYGRIAAVAAASDATTTIAWIAAPPAAASTTISTPRCFERGSRKNGRPNGTHCESTTTTADLPRKRATNQRERGKVARLAMNQLSNFEPDGLGQAEEMDVNIPDISDGGEGGEEEPRLVVPGLPSLAITREKLVIAGWSGLLGVAYAGGREDQKSYSARKRRLFESIGGDDIRDILEVGVGGNPKVGGFNNLEYYRRGQRIVGIDPALSGKPSSALESASTKAQDMGLTLRGVGGAAEDLPFESGSFDAVVSTLVFCSVRDPSLALREVSRVLRPGGKFLFVEHIHAQEEGLSIFGLREQQDLLDPLQQLVADGCHLTRETDQLIKNAVGGPPESRLFSRVESIETVRVSGMWPVSEQIFGVVVK